MTHHYFEVAVFALIILNMIVLALKHYKMSREWDLALWYADIVFTALFTVEAIFKLIGMRLYYFRDAFNVFDFFVIVTSIASELIVLLFCYFFHFSAPCFCFFFYHHKK